MASTTKRPALVVMDVANSVAETLRSLASMLENPNGDPVDETITQLELRGTAKNVETAAAQLKSELRKSTEILEKYGVELPEFPRFEA